MVKDPLELEGRRRAYELVSRTPGLHLRDLARRLDVDVRTALYHLDQLRRHGLVVEAAEGHFKRFFPRTANGRRAEIVDVRDKLVLGLLRKKVPLYVSLRLLTGDPATHGDLAAQAGVSASTLSYHLGRMQKAGLLTKEGSVYRLQEPDRVAQLLYTYRPTQDLLDRFVDLWEDFTL